MRYFMGIDNGGTFSKAALFDENGNQIAVASIFVPVITPKSDIQKEIWKHFVTNVQVIREANKEAKCPQIKLQVFLFQAREKVFIW